jgi:alpha-galactosidase
MTADAKGRKMLGNREPSWLFFLAPLLLTGLLFGRGSSTHKPALESAQEKTMGVSVNAFDGSYTIFDPVSRKPILHSRVAAEIDNHWLRSSDYPKHSSSRQNATADSGAATKFTISNTGLPNQPDLVYSLELHADPDFVTITVAVHNGTSRPITVQALRSVEATGPPIADLGATDASDRVFSDSFSEDRPGITIHNLTDATNGMHRAVGSQLIYNLQSKRNLFLGTLTSDKFLTILRLQIDKDRISSYEVDSAGTTELEKENSLEHSSAEDQIELSLPVAPEADLLSERLLISTGTDYHQQLETYGSLIRQLHHARVSAPSVAGWWSWTAYYFGLNQGTALTNAKWLAQNLKDLGYKFFHIDEGYQYARGEYTTPDATLFPDGVHTLENQIRSLGLTPGIWTAPFEVSERSSIYANHKDWLVHNASGQPIHAGWVIEHEPHLDPLYILDSTNPAAQDYLRKTYNTLTRQWGIRYIKLDFMDDSAIEGFYYKPSTTALEAQRIGLQIIREAVGDQVLLDKDGSPMLNPVGIVDTGRISVDTGHTFESSKEAAPGIAARYFMNRNFFVADPDAFTVSRQTVDEQEWHGGKHPLTLDEAKVSIALAAIAGGMYEIGDDLPTLGADPDRVALVKNQDLLNMTRLGRASRPLDLMSYTPEDGMPSIFLLQESKRQSMLTVFNWTERPTEHKFDLARDLGLQSHGQNQVFDVFNPSAQTADNLNTISVQLPPHSVKVLKIVDASIPPAAPTIKLNTTDHAEAGKTLQFSAEADPAGVPALSYRWDFGDGTSSAEANITHTYTHAGDFTVRLVANGLDGVPFEKSILLTVTGKIGTRFAPSSKWRLVPAESSCEGPSCP